jgi:hypothetical protein
MLFEGAVSHEPHPGGLRPPTFAGPRTGFATRNSLYLALRHRALVGQMPHALPGGAKCEGRRSLRVD